MSKFGTFSKVCPQELAPTSPHHPRNAIPKPTGPRNDQRFSTATFLPSHFNLARHSISPIKSLFAGETDLLFNMVKAMSEVDLHPDTISNLEMGYVFEHLVMKFND